MRCYLMLLAFIPYILSLTFISYDYLITLFERFIFFSVKWSRKFEYVSWIATPGHTLAGAWNNLLGPSFTKMDEMDVTSGNRAFCLYIFNYLCGHESVKE
jgi:hypothetical protein